MPAEKGLSRRDYNVADGYVSSIAEDRVSRSAMTLDSHDFVMRMRDLSAIRRGGTVVFLDDSIAPLGWLPAKWPVEARCRKIVDFASPSTSPPAPTPLLLFTKESMAAGVADDGRFATLTWYDDESGGRRVLGDDWYADWYAGLYPTGFSVPGSGYGARVWRKVMPLWYRSGEGGLTRGVSEFSRRFIGSGSRSVMKVGDDWLIPAYDGTHVRWDGKRTKNGDTASMTHLRLSPAGPMPPLLCPRLVANTADRSGTGSWQANRRFFFSCAFQDASGHIWMPWLPMDSVLEAPRTDAFGAGEDLASYHGFFEVPGTGPYKKLVWKNLPRVPHGCTHLVLLRTDSVDAAVGMPALWRNDALNLRVVTRVRAGLTEYEDNQGDDLAPLLDVDHLFIRDDHVMAPSARYLWGGDQRVCAGYTRPTPASIILAPVGEAAYGDLDVDDEAATTSSANALYSVRIVVNKTGGGIERIEFRAITTTGYASGNISLTGLTVQQLVDKINDDNGAVALAANNDSPGATAPFFKLGVGAGTNDRLGLWRAQVAPGSDPTALATTLLPHYYVLRSNTAANELTNGSAVLQLTNGAPPASAYADDDWTVLAVGAYIDPDAVATNGYSSETGTALYDTGVPKRQYVKRKDVTRKATLSSNWAGANRNGDVGVYFWLGDCDTDPPAATRSVVRGQQRCFFPTFPTILYSRDSAITSTERQTGKRTTYMTVGGPNRPKAAASAWVDAASNKHVPSVDAAGAVLGGGAVLDGFVVALSGAKYRIINTRETNSGFDADYRFSPLNPIEGCSAWASIAQADGCVVMMTPAGLKAVNLEGELLFSQAIFDQAEGGTGSLEHEASATAVATINDNDDGRLSCAVIRNSLHVCYRDASGSVVPDRRLIYDYSLNGAMSGPQKLLRGDRPWPWSSPVRQALSVVGEVTRGQSKLLFGAREGVMTSTGDGMLYQVDVGHDDDGTTYEALLYHRKDDLDTDERVSLIRVTSTAILPTAASLRLLVSRDLVRASQVELEVSSGSAGLDARYNDLPLPLRAAAGACEIGFKANGNETGEVVYRSSTLQYRVLKRTKR